VDDWRKNDPERVQRTITINYEKSRTPIIQGPDEDIKPPTKIPPALALCNTNTAWTDQKGLDIIKPHQDRKVGDNGFEPKTIALQYMKGQALYHLWPPVPEKSDKPSNSSGEAPEAQAQDSSDSGGGTQATSDGTTRERGAAPPKDEDEEDQILVHSATPFEAGAQDMDKIYAQCVPGGGDLILVGSQGESSATGMACQLGGEGGGEILENEQILDRALPGGDNEMSVLPDEFSRLKVEGNNIAIALGSANKTFSEAEKETKSLIRREFYAKRDIARGTALAEEDIILLRPSTPGQGFGPEHYYSLLGKVVNRDIKKGQCISRMLVDDYD